MDLNNYVELGDIYGVTLVFVVGVLTFTWFPLSLNNFVKYW